TRADNTKELARCHIEGHAVECGHQLAPLLNRGIAIPKVAELDYGLTLDHEISSWWTPPPSSRGVYAERRGATPAFSRPIRQANLSDPAPIMEPGGRSLVSLSGNTTHEAGYHRLGRTISGSRGWVERE